MSVRASREDGACWAAVATLGDDTNLDPRTVRRVLRQLEALGVIEAHRRPGRSTWYRIIPARIPRPAGSVEPQVERAVVDGDALADEAAADDHAEASAPRAERQGGHCARGDTVPIGGGHPVPPGRAPCPPGEGTMPPDPSRDPDLDPSWDPNQGGPSMDAGRPTGTSRRSSSSRPSRPATDAAFDEIVGIWADRVRPLVSTLLPDHHGLDPASDLGPLVDARLRDVGRDDVALVLQWYATAADDAPRAPFLRERITDLSTLMRPPKFAEYLGFARAWWAAGHPERREPESGSRWTPEQQRRGNEALRRARLAQEERSPVQHAGGRCAA